MRRLLFASLVACMLALMSLLSIPAFAGPCCGEALKCTIYLELVPGWVPDDDVPDWVGTIDGDIEGDLQLIEYTSFYSHPSEPFAQHYFEDFVIQGTGDDRIEGANRGFFDLVSFEFKYTGLVTDAMGDWEDLVGWKIHGKGVVEVTSEGLMTATGTMVLVPP